MTRLITHLPLLYLTLLLAACNEPVQLLPVDAKLPDGSQYRGELVDGVLHGQGRLDYPNGTWYSGHFVDGQLNGLGQWHGPAQARYEGEFVNGLFHGTGHLTQADGSQYIGDFAQHQFNGQGVLSLGGASYQGDFKDGLFHGLGVLKRADGSQYQGTFNAGIPEGPGVSADAYGNHYSGEFQNEQFNGEGRYESPNGDAWMGQFIDDAMTGQGQYTGADGSRYAGEFRNWLYHGNGQLTLADGSRYKGQFVDGLYQGQGVLDKPDGTRLSGIWQRGLRTRDEYNRALADPLEEALQVQGELLQSALDGLPSASDTPALYTLTLAGDGSQSVFMREAQYVSELLRERFGARANISLINHRDHLTNLPMATRSNLKRSLQTLSERLTKQDLLFIYLTSHGSADHQLQLEQPRLTLHNLAASELAQMLEPLAHIPKVIVISACYSGGFIEPLKNDNTLIMTAARADRVSFGCSEENDFTYFGRALFAEALGETDNLERAFEIARERVAEREQQDDFEASEPQLWAPRGVLQKWQQLRQQTQPTSALTQPAVTSPGDQP